MSGKKNREDRSGHSCALIYEPQTTPVSITVQQDDHITKLVTQTKTKTLWNVREPDRGHGRTRQNTTEHDRTDTEHTDVINILCADPLYLCPSCFFDFHISTPTRSVQHQGPFSILSIYTRGALVILSGTPLVLIIPNTCVLIIAYWGVG